MYQPALSVEGQGLPNLAPKILAAIEAAGEHELGVTENELRAIARMEERVQVKEWRRTLPQRARR